MDRKEIKALAKEKLKGNVWKVLWPALLIMVVYYVLYFIAVAIFGTPEESVLVSVINLVLSLIMSIFLTGYYAYLLGFVRDEEVSFETILNCVKEKWVQILITMILVSIFEILWTLLFIIPGIIKSFAYAMTTFIVVDTNLSGTEAIGESIRMMNGHKWEFFVFVLSFIGWILLGCITFGIAFIYVGPYISVAETIYYERLKGLDVESKGEVVEEEATEE